MKPFMQKAPSLVGLDCTLGWKEEFFFSHPTHSLPVVDTFVKIWKVCERKEPWIILLLWKNRESSSFFCGRIANHPPSFVEESRIILLLLRQGKILNLSFLQIKDSSVTHHFFLPSLSAETNVSGLSSLWNSFFPSRSLPWVSTDTSHCKVQCQDGRARSNEEFPATSCVASQELSKGMSEIHTHALVSLARHFQLALVGERRKKR